MAPDYDALSDGSELTGEESEDYASAPRTPKKRRRVIPQDDEEDEDEVAGALDDDDDDADADADADELDEDDEDYDAPSTSKRGATRTSARKSTREAATPKRAARTSTRTLTTSTTSTPASGKKSLRVKLTRTPNATAPVASESSPAPKSRPSRSSTTATASTSATRRPKDTTKVKWKPSNSSSSDELPPPTAANDDDDELDHDHSRAATVDPDIDSGSESSSSEPDEATAAEMAAIIGKTARQLAREGGVESEHMELPMFDPNRKKKLTENELALRRSETARKRKNQVEKKLEDDKVETINRLLKKQVGRSRNKLRAGSEEGSDEEAERERKRGKEELSRKALKERPAGFYRVVDGREGIVLGVPVGPPLVDEVLGANHVAVNRALVEELERSVAEGLGEKAMALAEKAKRRLEAQSEQWKEDHALDQVWGQEGLYEYQLRTIMGQSRKDWIGSRRPPTPETEEQPQEEEVEEEEAEAEQHEDEDGEDAAVDAGEDEE